MLIEKLKQQEEQTQQFGCLLALFSLFSKNHINKEQNIL